MKWIASVSRVLVGIGLAAVASATPQLTGSAVGHWGQLNTNQAVVLAQAPSDQSDTIYDVRMQVLGDGSGRVRGEMHQRPLEVEGGSSVIDLVYRLEGRHLTLEDGRIALDVRILLDLSDFGGDGMVEVGRMEGLLYSVPGSLGYCPVLPLRPAAIERLRDGAKQAPGGIRVIESSSAPLPLPGEFVARWILN